MTLLVCNVCNQPIPEGENGHFFKLNQTYNEFACGALTKNAFLAVGSGGSAEPVPAFHICKACLKKAVVDL